MLVNSPPSIPSIPQMHVVEKEFDRKREEGKGDENGIANEGEN